MAEKKPKVAPKPKAKKAPTKPKVDLVSYSIKMVIPTGEYANIQPEIIVKSSNVEAAHDFCAPHMNRLWKEYYLCNERRVEPPKPTPVATPQPVAPKETAETPPDSSVAMSKATQAIQSCTSNDALNLIMDQIEKSVKLTNADKDLLLPMINEKFEKDFKDKK